MKKSAQAPVITWERVRKCSPYNHNSKKCYLCFNEKAEIATYRGINNNKKTTTKAAEQKTEIISKCRVQNKYTPYKYYTNV